jgi:hypothetical protein
MTRYFLDTMKQIITIAGILILAISCREDFPDLITGYSLKWEVDLRQQYPSDISGQYPLNSYELADTRESVIVLSFLATGSGAPNAILTKVDYSGMVTDDLILPDISGLKVTLDKNNHLALLLFNNQNGKDLATYDTDFNILSSKTLDFGEGYSHTLAFDPSSIYSHRHVNGVQRLTKYDHQANVDWETPYKFIGCGGSTIHVLDNGGNVSLLAESYPDSIKVSHLSVKTGRKLWSKLFMKQSILPNGGYVKGAWTSRNKLILASFNTSGTQLMIALYDISMKTKTIDIEFPMGSYLSRVLSTKDGGLLLGIGTNSALDASNFRLVKLDSEGNAGWMGTFQQLGYDSLVDMIELEDGTIVVLTAKGYLQGLSPDIR